MSADPILADFDRLKSACQELSQKKILVGIVGDVDSEVLQIAHAHEYGDGRLPERSFIRASFDADQAALNSIVSGELSKVLSGANHTERCRRIHRRAVGAVGAKLHRQQPSDTAL